MFFNFIGPCRASARIDRASRALSPNGRARPALAAVLLSGAILLLSGCVTEKKEYKVPEGATLVTPDGRTVLNNNSSTPQDAQRIANRGNRANSVDLGQMPTIDRQGYVPPPPRIATIGAPTNDPNIKQAPISNVDECSDQLQDIGGALILYYNRNREMPPTLDALTKIPGNEHLVLECPISHKQYLYEPKGVPTGDGKDLLFVCDAEPNHSGYRWAIALPVGDSAMSARVYLIGDAIFNQK